MLLDGGVPICGVIMFTDDKDFQKSKNEDRSEMPERNAAYSSPPSQKADEVESKRPAVIRDWASI